MAYLQTNFGKWPRLLSMALFAAGAPLAAVAQEESAPTGPTAEEPWVKICNSNPNDNRELCLTIQEIKAETGQFIASASIRAISGDEKKSFVVAVPVGMLLQPGMRAQVDNGEQFEIPYGVCFPNACYGELEINNDFVASLKKGNQLVITTMNAQAKPVSFPLTLSGFTKAFDSAGLDPAGLQQRQQDLTKALQDKANAARERLREQQQKEEAN